jgi:hypothetical protein
MRRGGTASVEGLCRVTWPPRCSNRLTRPCAIPKSCAAGGQKRHEAGGAGAVGRAERSDGDENFRQVSGCRHGGWRAMPSVSGLLPRVCEI